MQRFARRSPTRKRVYAMRKPLPKLPLAACFSALSSLRPAIAMIAVACAAYFALVLPVSASNRLPAAAPLAHLCTVRTAGRFGRRTIGPGSGALSSLCSSESRASSRRSSQPSSRRSAKDRLTHSLSRAHIPVAQTCARANALFTMHRTLCNAACCAGARSLVACVAVQTMCVYPRPLDEYSRNKAGILK
jgi:hypothetical protein